MAKSGNEESRAFSATDLPFVKQAKKVTVEKITETAKITLDDLEAGRVLGEYVRRKFGLDASEYEISISFRDPDRTDEVCEVTITKVLL